MSTYTDKPQGQRPRCPECGEHRWSFSGQCLSVVCKPYSEWLKEIADREQASKSRRTRDPLVDPTTGRKRSRPTGRSRREAEEWYKAMGQEIPWEEKRP